MRDLFGRCEWHPERVRDTRDKESRRPQQAFPPTAQSVRDANHWRELLVEKTKTVIRSGLILGDELVFSWINDKELAIKGCQLQAKRKGRTLMWAPQGFGRDPSGMWVYLPYIRSKDEMRQLAVILTELSGYEFRVTKEQGFFLHLELFEPIGDTRRLIAGDHLCFEGHGSTVRVTRSQGTIDMNLYRPGLENHGLVFSSVVVWLGAANHHFHSFCRMVTEINGLQCAPSNGGFRVAK